MLDLANVLVNIDKKKCQYLWKCVIGKNIYKFAFHPVISYTVPNIYEDSLAIGICVLDNLILSKFEGWACSVAQKINTVLIGYSDWPPSSGLRSL